MPGYSKTTTGLVSPEISAFDVDFYLGMNSCFRDTCKLLSEDDNLMMKRTFTSFLQQKQRSHDDAIKFIVRYIDVIL